MKPFKMDGRPHFYIKFMYEGKRRFVNTWQTVEYKAANIGPRLKAEWIEKFAAKGNLTFAQLEAWDFEVYASKRENTAHFKGSLGLHWKRLAEFFTSPYDCSYERLIAYLLWRKEQRRKDGSPAWAHATLRKHFLTFRRGLLDAKENRGFTSLEVPKRWPKFDINDDTKGKRYASNEYETHELKAIIGLLQGHAQDTALFLAATGMRATEAQNCKIEHFKLRADIEGCAGTLYIPGSYTDQGREIAIPLDLLPIMKRALPFTVDHKRAFSSACKLIIGSPKFSRRDFRAGFISALADIDPFGAHIATGHSRRHTRDRYHNWTPSRMGKVALAAWQAFSPGRHGDQLVDEKGDKAYQRKRLKLKSALYAV